MTSNRSTSTDRPGPDWSKVLDVQMMTMLGGLQRTHQQYEVLLNKRDFAFTQEIDIGAGVEDALHRGKVCT